jgi:uncharacterized protein (TIGR02679 family)
MNNRANDRLRRLLGGENLSALRQRMRDRYTRLVTEDAPLVLRFAKLLPAEYEALAQLTGRPVSSSQSISIDVVSVDKSLRASGVAESLKAALEELDGPIVTTYERAEQQARWLALRDACNHPRLVTFLNDRRALGLLKRLARKNLDVAKVLLTHTSAVLSRLPANGVPRAQLAAGMFGDAHSLDDGEPVATLVLAVCRRQRTMFQDVGADSSSELGDELMLSSESVREIWAAEGVLVNELAKPALFLNLPVRALCQPGRRGDPAFLSLQSLLKKTQPWAVREQDVFVCENPNIVAIAADRLGPMCAPLVCTDGMPAAAQRTLLDQLAKAGARLHYHGDFDWAGITIANFVRRTWGAQPWRYGATDYEIVAANALQSNRGLVGKSVAADWDMGLTAAMRRYGRSVAEEAVVDTLLADLENDRWGAC